MESKLLIDAEHAEETRVAVVRQNRIEEFSFESSTMTQLRGNIYLAKVVRVEPSLQAAFVEYGGTRHGFLSFTEIHPDYYQIPVADRQALIEAQRALEEQMHTGQEGATAVQKESAAPVQASQEDSENPEGSRNLNEEGEQEAGGEQKAALCGDEEDLSEESEESSGGVRIVDAGKLANPEQDSLDREEEEDSEAAPKERFPSLDHMFRHHYRIQEVIKRRQILLVQVIKEERGNKGAALTTYLSLAGRYSVLMPNTARSGGVSRKIASLADRRRLREISQSLDVPEGMGAIIRTAGAQRTKTEICRDFEHLLRLWESIRTLTLKSQAPCLIYEEGSLIKRAIRDIYHEQMGEILISGAKAYAQAHAFMKILMPQHLKNLKEYKNQIPIFAKFGVEAQLDEMLSPRVRLPSGGSIVINQTEALVAVDVNSGKATRGHDVEETALKTNLEAAEELARQLRLRDLSGLIIIDFIDMADKANHRLVERQMRECLKKDRARIQYSRISDFGLVEMSRQRTGSGILESSTVTCPRCQGVGLVRSIESTSLHILRLLEAYLIKNFLHNVSVRTHTPVALYTLNKKRRDLSLLEQRFGVRITIEADDTLTEEVCSIEKGSHVESLTRTQEAIQLETLSSSDMLSSEGGTQEEEETEPQRAMEQEQEPSERGIRRRRRRGGRSEEGRRRSEGVGELQKTSLSGALPSVGEEGEGPILSEDSEKDSVSESEEQKDSKESLVPSERTERERFPRRRRESRRWGERKEETPTLQKESVEMLEAAAVTTQEGAGAEDNSMRLEKEGGEPCPSSREEASEEVPSQREREQDMQQTSLETPEESAQISETLPKEDVSSSESDSGPEGPEPPDDTRKSRRTGWWQRRSFF